MKFCRSTAIRASDMPVDPVRLRGCGKKAGLVKFDFLGLKTLTVIAKAEEFASEARHPIAHPDHRFRRI